MRHPFLLLSLATSLLATGCTEPDDARHNHDADPAHTSNTLPNTSSPATPPAPVPAGALTYHADIRPIMERACVSCHTQGNIGPFTLSYKAEEWSDGPAWWSSIAAASVASGEMPPWMPAQDCRPLHGSTALTAAEVEKFAAWARDGYFEGDEDDHVAPELPMQEPSAPRSPDLALALPSSYMPRTDRSDDYRCFLLDQSFEQETFITQTSVLPGQQDVVHHVILYMIPPEDVAAIEQLEARGQGSGYECFGGSGSALAQNIGGWVPGARSRSLGEGNAIVVPAGSRVVMQMHYNTINITSGEAPTDDTRALLWTLPAGQKPERELRVVPLANLGIEIKAGDAASSHTKDYVFPYDATLLGTTPHMHTLGSKMRLEVLQQAQSSCLIDIPRWDFSWQQSYTFAPEHSVQLKRGDVLRQSCEYDNSPANQQVIGGQPRTAQDVFWGDGTFDEMCLTYAIVALPYVPGAGLDCSVTDACTQACQAGDEGQCLLDCALSSSSDCAQCAFSTYFECAGSRCIDSGVKLQACANQCDNKAGQSTLCLQTQCFEAWSAFAKCAMPHIKSGTCEVGVCGGK